jgi:hypothetical protein
MGGRRCSTNKYASFSTWGVELVGHVHTIHTHYIEGRLQSRAWYSQVRETSDSSNSFTESTFEIGPQRKENLPNDRPKYQNSFFFTVTLASFLNSEMLVANSPAPILEAGSLCWTEGVYSAPSCWPVLQILSIFYPCEQIIPKQLVEQRQRVNAVSIPHGL